MSESAPAPEAQAQSSPAVDAADAKEPSRLSVTSVSVTVAPTASAAAASAAAAAHHFDAKADGGSLAGSGGVIKEAAPAHVHKEIDNSAAINANCTAAYNGQIDALKDAKEGLYEVGLAVVGGAPHALFHVPDGSGSGKPYRLLPLSSIIEPPAPPKVEVNPDESYYDEPKGLPHRPLPRYFAYWRAPVFYAAAAGRRDVVDVLIARHRDCAADRARIYTAKKKGDDKWEIVENAAETATTPKPKFVDAATVARANGFADVGAALDKSYRACSTEDCSVM